MSPAWSAVTIAAIPVVPAIAVVAWICRADIRSFGKDIRYLATLRSRRYEGRRRKPGTELEVRRVPFGDMLEPRPGPDYREDPDPRHQPGHPAFDAWFWGEHYGGPGEPGERPLLRTTRVGDVHLPLSGDEEVRPPDRRNAEPQLEGDGSHGLASAGSLRDRQPWRVEAAPGDPHYAWLDRHAQDVPRPGERDTSQLGRGDEWVQTAPSRSPSEVLIAPRPGPGHFQRWPMPPAWGEYDIPRTMARDHDITAIDSFPRISGGRDCVRPYGYGDERHRLAELRAQITAGAAW